MAQLSCFPFQSNLQRKPFAAQPEKGRFFCAHFSAPCTSLITIAMDTIFVVSIFVIVALELLDAALALGLLIGILATFLTKAARSLSPLPNEQP